MDVMKPVKLSPEEEEVVAQIAFENILRKLEREGRKEVSRLEIEDAVKEAYSIFIARRVAELLYKEGVKVI